MGSGPSQSSFPTAAGWEMESHRPFWQAHRNQGSGFGTSLGRCLFFGPRLRQAKCFYSFLGSCLLNPKEHANPKEKP